MKKPPRLEWFDLAELSFRIFQLKFIIVEILSLVGFLYLVYRLLKGEIGF